MRKLEEILYDCESSHMRKCRQGAAEFYVDLESTVATQPLLDGCEDAALASLYSIFQSARAICKKWILDFEPLYIIARKVMTEMRPFLSKWHKLGEKGAFEDYGACCEFRAELKELQEKIIDLLPEVGNHYVRKPFIKHLVDNSYEKLRKNSR